MLSVFPAAFFRIARHPPQDLTLKAGVDLHHVRPSQALNWKTPAEYLIERHPELASINKFVLPKLSNM